VVFREGNYLKTIKIWKTDEKVGQLAFIFSNNLTHMPSFDMLVGSC
jgi:hypothetical protein